MKAAWTLALVAVATPARSQVAGTVFVADDGPFCASIQAELHAIGVPTVEERALATWTVACSREAVVLESADERLHRASSSPHLAAEAAEFLRARLLRTPEVHAAAEGLSAPPSSREAAQERSNVEASMPPGEERRREAEVAPQRAEPDAETAPPQSADSPPDTRRDTAPETQDRLSLVLLASALAVTSTSFPALMLTLEPRAHIGDFSSGVHVGVSLASPSVGFLDEEGGGEIQLSAQTRFLDVGADVLYAPRLGPMALGIGPGFSLLRVRLQGEASEAFGLLNQTTQVWAPLPYLRAMVAWRAHRRVQLRLDGRAAWSLREIIAESPISSGALLTARGLVFDAAFGVEVFFL